MDMSQTIENLAPLFDLSRDAVVGVEDGSVVFANPAARSLYGIEAGAEAARLFPAPLLQGENGCVRSAGMIVGQEAEFSAVRRDDTLLVTITPRELHAPLSGSAGALTVMGDDLMTMRLAIDNLTAGLKAEQDPRLRRYAGILYRSYYRMKRTQHHLALAEMLDRWDAPVLRLLRLDEICRELCNTTALLTRELDVIICCETPDGYCPVMGDPGLVETMVLNLLANSLQHAKPGDEIRLEVSRRGSKAVIAVDDSGSGISDAGMASLFDGPGEPSLSDMASGAGLGLRIARDIAERLGGALLLESREDIGTRLRIQLPLYEAEGSTLAAPAPEYAPNGMETILTELSVVLDGSIYDSRFFD